MQTLNKLCILSISLAWSGAVVWPVKQTKREPLIEKSSTSLFKKSNLAQINYNTEMKLDRLQLSNKN